jgi:lysophospholipase L1-like esterase|tara:strand:- start:2095 stop:2733 length:639 start_codon:yes stop_codon:yes gene_type:complete
MKSILCFGDSNTWGYDPATKTRFSRNIRWTGVLQNCLEDDFYIIEEGLNGRTTNIDEREEHKLGYFRKNRNSLDLLAGIIESHYPLDLIVVMLGTNDLKTNFNRSANEIAEDMKLVCKTIISNEYFNSKSLLLVSPTHIQEDSDIILDSFINTNFKAVSLTKLYKDISVELGIHFLDAAQIVHINEIDGIHWDANQHNDFAVALANKIKLLI